MLKWLKQEVDKTFKFHCDSINIETDAKLYNAEANLNSTVILLI